MFHHLDVLYREIVTEKRAVMIPTARSCWEWRSEGCWQFTPAEPARRYRARVAAMGWSIYTCPAAEMTFEAVSSFVTDAVGSGLIGESLTVEFKERRSGTNVAEAIAAMANTDGGVVLLGISDKGSPQTRMVGVPASAFDALVDHLRSLIQPLPELIPVALPDQGERIIVVIRVDSDAYLHPLVVGGRIVYRVPGATVPADRQRVLS